MQGSWMALQGIRKLVRGSRKDVRIARKSLQVGRNGDARHCDFGLRTADCGLQIDERRRVHLGGTPQAGFFSLIPLPTLFMISRSRPAQPDEAGL
jgi:hypothetical protein